MEIVIFLSLCLEYLIGGGFSRLIVKLERKMSQLNSWVEGLEI